MTSALAASFYVAAREALLASLVGEYDSSRGLYDFTWRHHGLGMLQAELNDQLRVHIWHPKLKLLADRLRSVHDHRFDLVSAVVVGEIIDTPYIVDMVGARSGLSYQHDDVPVFEIAHAKIQGGGPVSQQVGTASVLETPSQRYRAGHVYEIDRREFHTTRVEELTITVVARTHFDDRPARVLESGESGIVKPDLTHWRVGDEDVSLVALRNEILYAASKALSKLPPLEAK